MKRVWLSIIPDWEGRDRQGDSPVNWVQRLAWPYYVGKLWLWPTDLASLKAEEWSRLIPNTNRSPPPACVHACMCTHTREHTYTHENEKRSGWNGKGPHNADTANTRQAGTPLRKHKYLYLTRLVSNMLIPTHKSSHGMTVSTSKNRKLSHSSLKGLT